MKKRIISLLMTFVTLITVYVALPVQTEAAETSGTCGDNLTWTLDDNGTLTISGTGAMWDYFASASAPPWYNSRSEIKNVIIEDGVTSIGDEAFTYCYNLASITIPNSVTSIGDSAFERCDNLTNLIMPDSVIDIGDLAFAYCGSLTSVTISNSVIYIDGGAFFSCSSLTSVTIPNSVRYIGDGAFSGCHSLTGVTIPNSVTSIGNNAFSYCDNLTSVTIPNSVRYIDGGAFSSCYSLTSVTIPDSVTYIAAEAFFNCYSLTSITIPDSVTSIGDDVFSACQSLEAINVEEGNSQYLSADGILFDKAKTRLITYPAGKALSSYRIPSSVTSIGYKAFYSCRSLTSITIPNSVTSIGEGAFESCSSLTSITILNGVTRIGDETFRFCDSLTSITIPNSVTSIGDGAFSGCRSLASVTIPNSVTSIGNNAFSSCDSLTSVTIPDSVTSIGYSAFYSCDSLTSVTIPNSVTRISNGAFSDCHSLTSVTIPDSVTSIGYSAFYYCDSLTDVYYNGSEAQWNTIEIESDNADLTNANIHFNSSGNDTMDSSNSTSEGAPVITSAKLTYNGTSYDIFTQAVTIQKDSDIMASIEAMVDDNGCKDVRVYITQGIGDEMDITGICKDFWPGKDFAAGRDIYILAVDADTGKSTSKKTRLKVSALADGSLGGESGVEGLNFKLGQNTGFTIPDSVPVFGGTEIDWAFDFIPISVEYDQADSNKLNVVFGTNITKKKGNDGREYFSDFDFAEYKKAVKKAASKQNRTLKQLRNDFKMSKDIKMNLLGGNLLGGGSSKKGNSVDVAGYAEMHYTENGWQFAEGQLCLNVEFTYNYQGQIFIWVIPLYYEFGGGAGVGFEGTMTDVNPISFSPEFEAYLTGKIKGSIGAGVGIAKVATAGAEGEAVLNLKKSLQNSYFKADVDGSANFNVKIFGKTVAEKEFAKGNFLIYETGNSEGLIDGGGVSLFSTAENGASNFEIDIDALYPNEGRSYTEYAAEWLGDEQKVSLMSADYTNKNLNKLADNIYTECAPQLCEVDDKKVMVMQWDHPDRADIDRTMLVYSVYDEENDTWSAPAAVDDDGTADFYPCFRDGWLVWQNTKSKLSEDMTLREIAQTGEICAAKWNGSGFDTPTVITDNTSLDTQPNVTAESDAVHVVWTTNSEDDITGLSGTNTIMRADYDGTSWESAAAVKSGLNAITNISTGIAAGDFCIAYVTDDDNDFDTIDDRDIRLITDGGEQQLTDNDVLDSNPVFVNNMLYYYSGGNIIYSDLSDAEPETVFDAAKAGLTDTFVVDSNAAGDTVVWWTKTLDGCTEVYTSLCKGEAWSDEIQVTDIGNTTKYPSGILNDDGTMLVAFNNGISENNRIVKTDLYTISVIPSYDIALTDAYFDEDAMTVTAYATVTNQGELEISAYALTLGEDNTLTVLEPLKAGESKEVEITYYKPEEFSKREMELSISLIDGEEYDLTNNSAIFTAGNADIVVENVSANAEDETAISADISNIGCCDAQNVTVQLREGSVSGAVLDEKALDLVAGEKQSVVFYIDKSTMGFSDATKQLYITAGGDFDEISLGNNDGYTYITSLSGAPDCQTEILAYSEIDGNYMINSIARNNTDTGVQCQVLSAVYKKNGLMKACGIENVAVAANDDTGVDIFVPCTIEPGDTIKTFMWKDTQAPLSRVSEITIE